MFLSIKVCRPKKEWTYTLGFNTPLTRTNYYYCYEGMHKDHTQKRFNYNLFTEASNASKYTNANIKYKNS